jgi:DNA topoisomerase-1
VCTFDGFLKVYEEKMDLGDEEEEEGALPPLSDGEALDLLELIPRQHWTKPPPRYTEAALIRELERRGIGRPSTFAAMVAIIKDRGYVQRQGRALVPTELGTVVCDMLVGAFPDLFDYGFTALMEDQLDDIANGRGKRVGTLEAFWADLRPALERAPEAMPKVKIEREKPEPTGQKCPKCGADLVRRKGRYGTFTGCSNYPSCRYVQRRPKAVPTGEACPKCGGDLVTRQSRRGPFVGCSNYPTCTFTRKAAADEPQARKDGSEGG